MVTPARRAGTAATAVGVITLVAGAALTVAPRSLGRVVGVPPDADDGLRVVGVVDLVIAAGLLGARRRWPWLSLRAAANPPTGLYLALLARRHDATALYPVAGVITALTVADLNAARVLRSAGDPRDPATAAAPG